MDAITAVFIVAVSAVTITYMVLSYLSQRDTLQAAKLNDAEKKYVDERIAEIDKALGKTLAPILDDIGQMRTKMNIEKYM